MKHLYSIITACTILVGCTSTTNDETVAPSYDKIHFTSESVIKPIGLIEKDGRYHFYYLSEKSWMWVSSNDLVYWTKGGVVDMTQGASGDIIYDLMNSSGLGTDSNTPLIIFYFDEDIKLLYSLDDGASWSRNKINLPAETFGNPKIARDKHAERWLMTTTISDRLILLESYNLLDWSKVTELTISNPDAQHEIVAIGQNLILLTTQGKTTSLKKLDASFVPIKETEVKICSESDQYAAFTQNQGRNFLLTTIDPYTLGIPKVLNPFDSTLRVSFPEEINNLALTKRRGSLSSLKGQGVSMYHFQYTGEEDMELLLFNEQQEELKLIFSKREHTLTIDQTNSSNAKEGELTVLDWNPGSMADFNLIIDYSTVEISASKGETTFLISAKPVFIYDQIKVNIDDKQKKTKAIFYKLKEMVN